MRGQDARFRLMFERSADAILLLDTAANLFVEYNQAALDMLRCTREELSALHPSALSPQNQPDGASSFTKANGMIATAMRNGSHRFEWIHRSPHRDDFPVEVLLTPLPVDDAPIIVVVWRDITERLRSEEALRQAQRLESLAVLAGGIAHDFNNLLAAMSGHLQAIRDGASAVIVEHVTQVEHAVTRAASLTRQLLAYGGHGTVAKEPVELAALGGVHLASETARGTTFRVVLPASQARKVESARRSSASARGRGTVLIVDDEATVRRSLSMMVRSLGFEPIEADSGERALELYAERGRSIAWVLMDVTMPQRDGHATFLDLRRLDPSVIVVLSSGWAEEELVRRFADLPPSAFVPKPFTVPELVAVLERLGLVS